MSFYEIFRYISVVNHDLDQIQNLVKLTAKY